MDQLKQDTYECLSSGLKEVLGKSRSLIAESEIRNLNVGLCLLQCGMTEHPLVQSMILGNKRFVAYWSNDPIMERMLESWLQSEMLLALKQTKDNKNSAQYDVTYLKMKDAAANFLEPMRKESQGNKFEKIFPYAYTMLMAGHLVRNMYFLRPEDPLIQSYFDFSIQFIFQFSHFQLENKQIRLLDFCISFFAGLESLMSEDLKKLHTKIIRNLQALLEQETFWDTDDDTLGHLLMDLHIADKLPEKYIEKGIRQLNERINSLLRHEPVNMQTLSRLTRSLGELAKKWDDIPNMLQREITSVYSKNILEEIERVVIDHRGLIHPDITAVVETSRKNRTIGDETFLWDLFIYPLKKHNREFKLNVDLEYVDIVKPPYQTLRFGGDCDCIAALFAALLLAAGHKRVHLFHLSKTVITGSGKVILYHAVACLAKDESLEKEFYCFDLQNLKEGQTIPQLIEIDKKNVDLIDSNGVHESWNVYARKTLDAQYLIIKNFLEDNDTLVPSGVRGLYVPNPTETQSLFLPKNIPTWVLMYLDDDSGICSRLKKFMIEKVDQRRTNFADIITYYGDPLFDQYREAFGLNTKKIQFPALVLYFFDPANNQNTKGKKTDPDNPLLLDYDALQVLETELGFEKLVVELQKHSLSRDFSQIRKLVKSSGRKQTSRAIKEVILEFSAKLFGSAVS